MTFTGYKARVLFFILPQLLITAVFFTWPVIDACIQSFFFSDAFGLSSHFAGFANYIDLMCDATYWRAMLTTLIMSFFIMIITMGVGLLAAVMVHGRKKSQKIYKILLLWPYAVAPAIAALLWRFLCQPGIGWLAQWLETYGIIFNYLTHPKQALAVIVIAASWQQFSYNFLFFLAALKAIPPYLFEAATLDGASSWKRFWQIIFPLLSPTTFFLGIMNLMYAFFDTFGIIDILTRGGPNHYTTTLMYKVYQDGFIGMDPGSAATQSVLLMGMVIVLTFIQFRYLEKKVHYQ